jgi:TolB-like protein
LIYACAILSCATSPEVSTEPAESPAVAKPAVSVKTDTQVAIMNFKILAQDTSLEYLAEEIPQSLTSAFINGGIIQPVERQQFEELEGEMITSQMYSDKDEMLRLGRLLGADYLLLGSLTVLGDAGKINCRLIKTETGEIVFTDDVTGNLIDLFAMEEELAARIEERLVR